MNTDNTRVYRSKDLHWVGNGFPVRSIFGYNDLDKQLSPFLLMDYAAPYEFSPSNEKRGVEGHPHRGFETVTIAYQGEVEHRDSSGGGGIIGPGDVQWMTAASGLVHEEFHSSKFTNAGGLFEMIQLWVNLPAKDKNVAPGYQSLAKANIPVVSFPKTIGEARIIAGELYGVKGAAKTFTPINIWDASMAENSSLELPVPQGHTKAILVRSGQLAIGENYAGPGELAIMDRDSSMVKLVAKSNTQFVVLTGEPIDEPVVGYGPFVMNSDAEIKQAFADYKMGKFGFLD